MNRRSLGEGQTGMCRVRKNTGGAAIPINHGRITSMVLDPIERKSLRRSPFGSVVLSVESFGCSLRYPLCQNHKISVTEKGGFESVTVSPEELVQKVAELEGNGSIGIVYTYNKPLVGWECVRDVGRLTREAGTESVIATNGSISDRVLNEVLPVADAMNIGLKGFIENYYGKLGDDLEIVKHLITCASRRCHMELTAPIIPGKSDSGEEMKKIAGWISLLSPEIPLHVTRFFPR